MTPLISLVIFNYNEISVFYIYALNQKNIF